MNTFKPKPMLAGAIIALGTMVIPGLWAQSPAQSQNGSSMHKDNMQMGNMMKKCRTHMHQMQSSMDQAIKALNQAKQSDNMAKMRTAMNDTEMKLSSMKDNMGMCMDMMTMMQNMHNMHGNGMMSGQGHSSAPQK